MRDAQLSSPKQTSKCSTTTITSSSRDFVNLKDLGCGGLTYSPSNTLLLQEINLLAMQLKHPIAICTPSLAMMTITATLAPCSPPSQLCSNNPQTNHLQLMNFIDPEQRQMRQILATRLQLRCPQQKHPHDAPSFTAGPTICPPSKISSNTSIVQLTPLSSKPPSTRLKQATIDHFLALAYTM